MAHDANPREREARALIRRYFDEVWNQGDLAVLDEIIDPEYINHSPSIPHPRPGPGDLKPIVQTMRQAICDLHYEILDMVVGEDRVAVYVRMTGTHSATLFGVPGRGARLDVRQMQFEWLRNGRIWQHWRLTDEAALLRQMSDPAEGASRSDG
jgi:steroid delta-isomerase-like uncharacterized protein